ncbi:hypothetical protein ACPOL_3761 [Acidisarcina polymorpha]|uniref:Uncharacterized protein n=1 Tax=Acidisarcina polymorpha TaxID=2211140 RepID=A0A2Z5G1Z2_9BACT|nr:hypothetical protein ACPOL_3761 [Acidisarcina polymorpha]
MEAPETFHLQGEIGREHHGARTSWGAYFFDLIWDAVCCRIR